MKKRGKTEDRIMKIKKGVSPIVSTALLIVIVVILAVIIFLWASTFIEEAIEKEIGGVKKTADKFCSDVNFEASIIGEQFYIVNRGNVPIYSINVNRKSAGTSTIKNHTISLGAGDTSNLELSKVGLDGELSGDKVIITPVLLGKAGKTKKIYTCPESVGYELEV